MKKRSKIILTVIFMSVILFFISCPIVNNISAKRIIEDINVIPFPQNTYIVEQFSHAGKLVGNGNGMQFFGAILIESELSLEDLDKHYSLYRETPWDYIVEVQDTQNLKIFIPLQITIVGFV